MTFDFTATKPDISRSAKWARSSAIMGMQAPADTIPMWIAQMDFAPAPFLKPAMEKLAADGEYGYFIGLDQFQASVAWWFETRFGWRPNPDHVIATHGLGNAIGMAIQTFSDPGDGIIVFSPVYHEFGLKIGRNNRRLVESALIVDEDGRFQLDLDSLEPRMTGREKIMIISSPHNPAGRIWTVEELRAMAAFCDRHDLILISDEIHMDLVFSGHTQVPTALAVPEVLPRLIVMSAASKTFDIAGLRAGYAIIPDDDLRARYTWMTSALDIQPNRAGVEATIACYSDDGIAWLTELLPVLEHNAALLDACVSQIPGARAMPMQGTFLSWIDFADTGMPSAEILRRVHTQARLAVSPGPAFGTGGETAIRINIGTPTARLQEALTRLQEAFADLQ